MTWLECIIGYLKLIVRLRELKITIYKGRARWYIYFQLQHWYYLQSLIIPSPYIWFFGAIFPVLALPFYFYCSASVPLFLIDLFSSYEYIVIIQVGLFIYSGNGRNLYILGALAEVEE
jgi:hypothetical protein